jgi:hypothetical protein
MDALYLGLMAVLFALSWGLVNLCAALGKE